MIDWAAIIAAASAAFIAALHVLNQCLHRNAIMRATPEQLQALDKMPVPSALVRRAGPSVLMLMLSGGLVVFSGQRDVQLAREPESDRAAVARAVDAASGKVRCDEQSCPKPARCVSGQCQDAAGKPVKLRSGQTERQRAVAGEPDSALDLPNTWDPTPRAFAGRVVETW